MIELMRAQVRDDRNLPVHEFGQAFRSSSSSHAFMAGPPR